MVGGGDGCKFAIGPTRAVYLGLARLHEALHGWKGEEGKTGVLPNVGPSEEKLTRIRHSHFAEYD